MLISTGRLARGCLDGRVAIVTGAGRGIGYEASRALLWLGARVAIAEIDEPAAKHAQAELATEWGGDRVLSVATDVGDEASVSRLVQAVEARFGAVDVVLNNATFAPTGAAAWETPLSDWDRSYAANLRGPVLLARACVPSMRRRGRGVFACVSSVGGPYQSAYESLKAAQVSLANALDAELDGSGVIAFTIGPGLVPTATDVEAVGRLVPRLGLSGAEFLDMTRDVVLSVEAAGAGFAAAVAMAERYAGQEVSSTQALVDAGIALPDAPVEFPVPAGAPAGGAESQPANGSSRQPADRASPQPADRPGAGAASPQPADRPEAAPPTPRPDCLDLPSLCAVVRTTLDEQAAGWRRRSFFERQWMLRDFRQRVGTPVERCLEALSDLERRVDADGGRVNATTGELQALRRLAAFHAHTADLAQGYVKDPAVREEQVRLVRGWQADVERLIARLEAGR